MNRTKIEWVKNPDGSQGYTWNPITGCLNGCSYCYARKLAEGRLRNRYLANDNIIDGIQAHPTEIDNPFYPRYWPEKLKELPDINDFDFAPSKRRNKVIRADSRKSRGIFCCNMSDLFGIGVPADWTRQVIESIRCDQWDRFYLLTKQPQNLAKFSPFPDNCWVGVSVTNRKQLKEAKKYFQPPISSAYGIYAKIKYLSIEPLLDSVVCKHEWTLQRSGGAFSRKRDMPLEHCVKCGNGKSWGNHNNDFIGNDGKAIVDWIIIGSQTKPYKPPKIEWVQEIVEAADEAGVPVFLKNNLKPLLKDNWPNQPWAFKDGYYTNEEHPEVDRQLRQEMPV